MAIYHLSVQIIGRKSGCNAKAAAAYRAGEKIAEFDYTRKTGVDYKEILTPENSPEWCKNRAELWSRVEAAEKRKDAQLCREINLALPLELKPAEREVLLKEFASQFVSLGMVADITIHGQTSNNPHGHIMLTTRELASEGFGQKVRDWNRRELLDEWRSRWEELANKTLAIAGHEARIDHRTLEAQGIDREPTRHKGKFGTWLERKEPTLVRELHHQLAEQAQNTREIDLCRSKLAKLNKETVVDRQETIQEREERLYGKPEKKKDINEIYAEARELRKKDLENKEIEERKRKRQELIAKRGYTDEQEKEYTILVNEFEHVRKLCIVKEVFNFRYDPDVLKSSLATKPDFEYLSETKRNEEMSNIEDLLLLKKKEKENYTEKVDRYNARIDNMNIIKKCLSFKNINATAKEINKKFADFDGQISMLEQEKEACIFLHKYYSIVETLKLYQTVKEKMESHPVHSLKLKEQQQVREQERQRERQQGQYRGR